MMLRAGLVTLVLAAAVSTACGEPSSTPPSTYGSPTKITTTEGGSPSSISSQATATRSDEASPTTEREVLTDLVAFTSPSGNVGCDINSTEARCDIRDSIWAPPARPTDCEFDYGQGINLSSGEKPNFVCAGDTTLGSGSPLPFGQSVSAGRLRCESAETGITCIDSTTKHGFSIGRQRYKLF